MDKIIIKLYQDNNLAYEKTLNAQVNKNKITYFDDVLTQIIKTDNGIIFKRYNDEYEFTLNITNQNTCTYLLKKEQTIFDIDVINASYIYEESLIEICYEITTNEEKIHLIIIIN